MRKDETKEEGRSVVIKVQKRKSRLASQASFLMASISIPL
jgi:hypothetical protein